MFANLHEELTLRNTRMGPGGWKRYLCLASHIQLPASHSPRIALTNALAFFIDHCSGRGPNRATCPFWHLKSLSFAVSSQSTMPV